MCLRIPFFFHLLPFDFAFTFDFAYTHTTKTSNDLSARFVFKCCYISPNKLPTLQTKLIYTFLFFRLIIILETSEHIRFACLLFCIRHSLSFHFFSSRFHLILVTLLRFEVSPFLFSSFYLFVGFSVLALNRLLVSLSIFEMRNSDANGRFKH